MRRKEKLVRKKALAWILTAMVFCLGTTAVFAEEGNLESVETGMVTAAETGVVTAAAEGEGSELQTDSGIVQSQNVTEDSKSDTGANDSKEESGGDSGDKTDSSLQETPSQNENAVFFETVQVDPKGMKLGGTVKYDSSHSKLLEEGEFSFVLTDATTGKVLQTVKNDSEGKYAFGSVLMSEVGTYQCTVEQKAPEIADQYKSDYQFDNTVYTITITVEKDTNDALKAVADVQKGAAVVKSSVGSMKSMAVDASSNLQRVESMTYDIDNLDFTNEYNGKSIFVQIKGKKTLTGKTLAKDEFSFILSEAADISASSDDSNSSGNNASASSGSTASNVQTASIVTSSQNTQNSQTVKNDADGKILFDTLSFDSPGVYIYKIKEDTSSKESGVTYDTTVYYAVVNVFKDLKGNLKENHYLVKAGVLNTVTEIISGSGKTVDEISFANSYSGSSSSDGGSSTNSGTATKTSTSTSTTPAAAKSSGTTSSNSNTTSTAGKAKTGDETPIGPSAALFVGFASVLIGMMVFFRRKKDEQNQE